MGDKVLIRKILPEDFGEVAKHCYTLSIAEPMTDLARIREVFSQTGFWTETSGAVAVVERKTGRLLGTIHFFRPEWRIEGFEIGYITHSTADRGKGYMTEAVTLLTRHLFEEWPDLNRIQIQTHSGNPASERVAEKCGYFLEAELRDAERIGDRLVNKLIYSILRRDQKNEHS